MIRVNKELMSDKKNIKINEMQLYFGELKKNLHTDSQITIRYHYLKYKVSYFK
jgi:hypothetical protein